MPTSSLKDLVRNPLGTVALFISLIYGVASLLLGATASYLPPDERIWLIKFVIFFPLVVLWVLYLYKVLYSAMLADRSLNGRFKLILVVVYSFSKDELPLMERMLRLRVEKCPAEIDLHFLAYEDVIA